MHGQALKRECTEVEHGSVTEISVSFQINVFRIALFFRPFVVYFHGVGTGSVSLALSPPTNGV